MKNSCNKPCEWTPSGCLHRLRGECDNERLRVATEAARLLVEEVCDPCAPWFDSSALMSVDPAKLHAEALQVLTQRAGGELFIQHGPDIKVGTLWAKIEEGGVRFRFAPKETQ